MEIELQKLLALARLCLMVFIHAEFFLNYLKDNLNKAISEALSGVGSRLYF